MEELYVKREILLNADTTKVWDALTNPKMTRQYFLGCEVTSDWKAGSPISWKGYFKGNEKIYIKGIILKIDQGRLVEYSKIDVSPEYKDIPDNYVKTMCELIPKYGKTLLVIKEGDYSNVEDGLRRYAENLAGWDYVINGLRELIEGKPKPKTETGPDDLPNEWLGV